MGADASGDITAAFLNATGRQLSLQHIGASMCFLTRLEGRVPLTFARLVVIVQAVFSDDVLRLDLLC